MGVIDGDEFSNPTLHPLSDVGNICGLTVEGPPRKTRSKGKSAGTPKPLTLRHQWRPGAAGEA